MNIITQEAKKRHAVVKLANRKGKSHAGRMYGVSLSSVKWWCKRYDDTWKSQTSPNGYKVRLSSHISIKK